MALLVEIEILKDNHRHAGQPAPKGSVVRTNPNTAQRMIDKGWAKKVGVYDPDRDVPELTDVVEAAADEAEPDED